MAKRILVIDGHPDPDRGRFCHALAEAYIAGARETGNDVRSLTLAELSIPFLMSSREFADASDNAAILGAQKDLSWCTHLVLVFPLWLGGPPALLKAFLEQVARGDFFADVSTHSVRAKLSGRSARLIVTMGMPALFYRIFFLENGVRNVMHGVIGFAGFKPVERTLLGAIEAVSESERSRRLRLVHQLGRRAR